MYKVTVNKMSTHSYQLTSADLPVIISTINTNDVIMHTKMAVRTPSLSLIDFLVCSDFLAASFLSWNAIASGE